MDKFIKGQIISYCQFVKCGKPAAMMALKDRYVEEAKNLIDNQFNLSVHIENLSEGWKTVWIYKEKYVLEIFCELNVLAYHFLKFCIYLVYTKL